jgi:hypothetical protein
LARKVIEGEFGAELEAGGAVMPHAFVVQHRFSHIAAAQGQGASERGGVLEGLGGALAKRGKHRVCRVPEQTDAALHPGFERVTIVEAPFRGKNDRPRQSEQVVSTGAARECLAHLAKDLTRICAKAIQARQTQQIATRPQQETD